MSFKIIAIKPLSGSEEHLKNLKPETTYYLNQDYKIQLHKIELKKSQPKNFFSKQSIEICAIVGKNGSGKSSLTNLLVKFINNIFYYLREDNKNEGLHVVNKINNMFVEVYYHVQDADSDSIYRVILDNTSYQVEIFRTKTIDSSIYEKITDMEFSIENFGKYFFYTQVIDYSLYSFNSSQEGDWINNIFHKNDSYQTPVVLNPYRKRGNIDINVENILSDQRFLSNIIREKSNKQITDSLKVHKIHLSLKPPKDLRKQIINDIQYDLRYIEKDNLFSDFNDFFKCNRALDSLIKRRIVNYLVYKLASIAIKYNEYNKFYIFNDTENGNIQNQKNKDLSKSLSVSDISDFLSTRKKHEIVLIDIQSFFKQIQEDHSHITFKIKQIINYLKYNHLNTLEDGSIDFQKPFKDIEGIENLDTIEFLPPPIFKVKIELVDSFNKKVEFETLSSGEKQMIFSQNSLFYHLRNLESVSNKFNKQKIQYQNINIILDEIELYFHPEYQRKYIKRLITGIEDLDLVNIKNISLIFSTHSPFILSDIPSLNVLKLSNGNPNLDNEIDKTFGANIYDLLKDNFFLDGFIGEFALKKSFDLINFLSDDIFYENWDEYNSEQTINLIAEPIVREKFRNLYNKKFKTDLDIKKEIEKLQNILKKEIMIPIGNSKVKDYLSASHNIKRFESLSLNILNRLKLISREDLIKEEIDFLESIIDYFSDKNFFTINPKEAIEILKTTPNKKVKDLIYNEFNYEARRRDTFPKFFNFLGIKTCVYCHAQFALSFENSEGKFVGLLQADHYNSKDKYPYLSVAFYNLYPVCGNCNLNKSNIDVEFELYSNKASAINLQFKIEDKSFIKNFLEFDKSKLKIEIQYNEDYINKFYLNEIYKTQTDIVEELVYKSKVYNTTYRENLKKFDIDDSTIDRFIVGNYTLKDDVYKRPLSKMMTDIATDLDLIK